MRRLLLVLLGLVVVGALATQAFAWYHLRAGRAALERYQTAEARRHLDACLRVWSGNETAHLLAARAARRVVEQDPGNDEARWWLGVGLQESGQFDEALSHLEHLRGRGWPDPDLRARIARSLDRVGRTAEARTLLDEVLADNPESGLAL